MPRVTQQCILLQIRSRTCSHSSDCSHWIPRNRYSPTNLLVELLKQPQPLQISSLHWVYNHDEIVLHATLAKLMQSAESNCTAINWTSFMYTDYLTASYWALGQRSCAHKFILILRLVWMIPVVDDLHTFIPGCWVVTINLVGSTWTFIEGTYFIVFSVIW